VISPTFYWFSAFFGYTIMAIAVSIQMNILKLLVAFSTISDAKWIRKVQFGLLMWWAIAMTGRVLHFPNAGNEPNGFLKNVTVIN
jgi:hypothetical protein